MTSTGAMHKKLADLQAQIDIEQLDDACEEIDKMEDGGQFIPDLLTIIEQNPAFDFGAPGPIVHTVERYFRRGYEEKLFASVSTKPTELSVWMLNRIINGTSGLEKEKYIVALKRISSDQSIEPSVRDAAKMFLE